MSKVSIKIYEDHGFALIEVGGEVHGKDIVEAAHALQGDARWKRHFDIVWDGRTVTSLILEPDDLCKMVDAKVEASTGKEVTVAVRVLDVEMAKLCALLLRGRGREAKVVGTLEEAFAELDIEEVPGT